MRHLELVAWLNIAMGVMGVIGAFIVFGTLGGAGLLSGDAGAAATLAFVGTIIAGIATLLSVPSLLGGWGLLRGKRWARGLVLIVSVLNLFGFPVGTLIGGYSIWVLMTDPDRTGSAGH